MPEYRPRWDILVSRQAERTLHRLPADIQTRIAAAITDLETNPRPPGCKKLQGGRDLYRLRIGDWRLIYAIRDAQLIIVIVKLGHRREIYRDL